LYHRQYGAITVVPTAVTLSGGYPQTIDVKVSTGGNGGPEGTQKIPQDRYRCSSDVKVPTSDDKHETLVFASAQGGGALIWPEEISRNDREKITQIIHTVFHHGQ
jgi:hypothetical protein